MELVDQCLRTVARHAAKYPVQVLGELPRELLGPLSRLLSAGELLRLESLLKQRNLNIEELWQICFELRWHKTYERFTGVFNCQEAPAQTKYLNKHFQEIFYQVINSRWRMALNIEDKIHQPIQTLHHRCPTTVTTETDAVSDSSKSLVLGRLRLYAEYADRLSLYCSHTKLLLQQGSWLRFLVRMRALRLIMLMDGSFSSTMTVLHHLRRHGDLEEVNVFTCRLNEPNMSKFIHFCSSTSPDPAFSNLPCNSDLPCNVSFDSHSTSSVDSDDGNMAESFRPSKKIKLDVSENSNVDDTQDEEAGKSDFTLGAGNADYDDILSVEAPDLYDAALLPISQGTSKKRSHDVTAAQTPDGLDRVRSLVDTLWSRDPLKPTQTDYSKVTCLSIHQNFQNNILVSTIMQILPSWKHLRALALEFYEHAPSSALIELLGRDNFKEFQWLDGFNPNFLEDLPTIAKSRTQPMKYLKILGGGPISFKSTDIELCPRLSFVEHLEVNVTFSLCDQALIRFLQHLLERDHALRRVSLGEVLNTDRSMYRCLQSLRSRDDSGLDLRHVDLSSSAIISRQHRILGDIFATELSPLKISTLASLDLNNCDLYKVSSFKDNFLEDIISHCNLRELYLAQNKLEAQGCHLLEKICTSIIRGQSKLRVLDLSHNAMSGASIVKVGQMLQAIILTKRKTNQRRQGAAGHRLTLSGNLLNPDQQQAVQATFLSLFDLVEAMTGESSIPLADYLGQM